MRWPPLFFYIKELMIISLATFQHHFLHEGPIPAIKTMCGEADICVSCSTEHLQEVINDIGATTFFSQPAENIYQMLDGYIQAVKESNQVFHIHK